jgi:hypothetical protein
LPLEGPRRQWLVLGALGVGLFAVYLANGARFLGGDTLGSPYTALSLLRDGDFYIQNLIRDYPASSYWFLRTPRGTVSILGFGTPLAALPVYELFNLALGGHWTENRLLVVGKIAGAAMTAGAAVLIAVTARRFVSLFGAVVVALVFALGSPAWSVSSQALWKHSPAALCLAAGLALLVSPRWERWIPLAAIPLGFAGWCRENLVLLVGVALVYVIVIRGWRTAAWFAGVAALVVGGLLALNWVHFGSPFASAQRTYALEAAAHEGVRPWDTPLWLGLYGTFFSPSRGLLVYAPVFLASAVGLVVGWRTPERATWLLLAAGAALAIAPGLRWHWWWGGDNFGPRMATDAAPFLALLIVPAWRWGAGRPGLAVAFGAAALFSLVVQAAGAFTFQGAAWDERSAAESVNRHPERLLRWSDSQLGFYLRFPRTHPDRIPWR